jgi:hypothetical protein
MLYPFSELDLVPMDLLSARLSDIIGYMKQPLIMTLTRLPHEQNATLLECLTHGS